MKTVDMLVERTSASGVDDTVRRLTEAAAEVKFGVLGTYDLKQKMHEKGVDFGPECRIIEVCNPAQAKTVLERDMTISTALPCRISVYGRDDRVTVAMMRPTSLLDLFGDDSLHEVAEDVEARMLRMIEIACAPA